MATRYFLGTVDGELSKPANWDGGTLPASTDACVLSNNVTWGITGLSSYTFSCATLDCSGHSFYCDGGDFVINGDVHNAGSFVASTYYQWYIGVLFPTNLTINGNIVGGAGIFVSANSSGVSVGLTVTGNITLDDLGNDINGTLGQYSGVLYFDSVVGTTDLGTITCGGDINVTCRNNSTGVAISSGDPTSTPSAGGGVLNATGNVYGTTTGTYSDSNAIYFNDGGGDNLSITAANIIGTANIGTGIFITGSTDYVNLPIHGNLYGYGTQGIDFVGQLALYCPIIYGSGSSYGLNITDAYLNLMINTIITGIGNIGFYSSFTTINSNNQVTISGCKTILFDTSNALLCKPVIISADQVVSFNYGNLLNLGRSGYTLINYGIWDNHLGYTTYVGNVINGSIKNYGTWTEPILNQVGTTLQKPYSYLQSVGGMAVTWNQINNVWYPSIGGQPFLENGKTIGGQPAGFGCGGMPVVGAYDVNNNTLFVISSIGAYTMDEYGSTLGGMKLRFHVN